MRHVSDETSEVHLGFSTGFVAPENKDEFFAGSEGHTGSDVLARELCHVYSQEFISGPGFRLSESFWNSERLDAGMCQIVSSALYGIVDGVAFPAVGVLSYELGEHGKESSENWRGEFSSHPSGQFGHKLDIDVIMSRKRAVWEVSRWMMGGWPNTRHRARA